MADNSEGREGVARALLHEALNLVVRARALDGVDRREAMLAASSNPEAWQKDGQFDRFVERHNAYPENAHRQIERACVTNQLWVVDQYEKDLADWERRARAALINDQPHD